VLRHLGIGRSCYHRWVRRAREGRLEDRWPDPVHLDRLLPEEIDAVVAFALDHPRDGYRRLAWMMVDEDVAYVSPSSVYRVLKARDLLRRYKRSERSSGVYDFTPKAPHQQWHTDVMYLRVGANWFFFIGVLDAWSRYLVHWELRTTMTTSDVTLVVQGALDRHPGESPRIVHDRGTQFVSREWKGFVREAGLLDIRTALAHPESNGVLERLHRSLREGLEDRELRHLVHARELVDHWVQFYNHRRLHSALNYLRPVDYLCGDPEALLAERRRKLAAARARRRQRNASRLHEEVGVATL
jgi:transposase InsO family protein